MKSMIASAVLAMSVFIGGTAVAPAQPDNVILCIGDGMGFQQVQAGAYKKFGQAMPSETEGKLSFEKFPVTGYATTFSSNRLVTDSAAAGTALACGVKTNNGALGITPDEESLTTLAEMAKHQGKAVAIVTSVPADHATPAAFYAEVLSRSQYNDITRQFFEIDFVDVLFGGGLNAKYTKEELATMAKASSVTVYTMDNLDSMRSEGLAEGRILGYFDASSNNHLDYPSQRGEDNMEPFLDELAVTALGAVMNDEDGFFMMLEGGTIDWACHGNHGENSSDEVLEFERAIEKMMDKLEAAGELESTLIVVTADHETGGMGLNGPHAILNKGDGLEFGWTTSGHTSAVVPVYAFGPGSERFAGKQDNTQIAIRIRELMAEGQKVTASK